MRVAGFLLLASMCYALSHAAIAASNPAEFKDDHVAVELLAEHASFKPGTRAWIGVKLTHEPHWHTYWMNPGDSGLPTRLEWRLPDGFRADEIAWPAPQRFELGGLYNFGYDGVVLLPTPIDIPADVKPGAPVTISVSARWVVCNDDLCIPGKATLQLAMPVTAIAPVANPKTAALFTACRAQQPVAADWQGQAVVTGDRVSIELRGVNLPSAAGLDAFPAAAKLLDNSPLKIARQGERLILEAQRNEYFETAPATITLILTQKNAGWRVEVPWMAGNTSGVTTVR